MTLATKCTIGCSSVIGVSAPAVVAVKHLNSSTSNTEEDPTSNIETPPAQEVFGIPTTNDSKPVSESLETQKPAEVLPEVKTEEIQNQDLKKILDWAKENGGCKIVIKKTNGEEELSENTEDLPGLFSEIDKYKSVCKLANGVRGKAENPNMLFERENGSWIAARDEGEE